MVAPPRDRAGGAARRSDVPLEDARLGQPGQALADGSGPLLAAGIDELMAVDGVGEQRARAVREGLSRLAESSILERYV